MDDDTLQARIEGNTIVANIIRGYQRQLAAAEAERDALREAAKTLQRLQFILGGHDRSIVDCDDGALRLNAMRALELLSEKLPPLVAALARKEPQP